MQQTREDGPTAPSTTLPDPRQAVPRMLEIQGEHFVRPDYLGRSLPNIASTILSILVGPQARSSLPPLHPSVLPPSLLEGVKTVLLVVADGLGHNQLLREIERGNAPTLARLIHGEGSGAMMSNYATITSVFPTTTVAALGSLNSGVTPPEHGLLGYTVYLDEFRMVAEMIRWGPADRRGSFSDRDLGGANPDKFFWVLTLYQRLRRAGLDHVYTVNPSGFARTPLTRMLHRGAEYVGYAATSSLSVVVPRILEQSQGPTYVYAYWPTVDSITHLHGPFSEEHGAEVAAFDLGLQRLLDRIPSHGDTLVLLTADHGHVETTEQEQVILNDYPDLVKHFAVPPAGERRATYLYAAEGHAEDMEAVAREQLRELAVILTREEAFELGLFGPSAHPSRRAASRIGDVLVLPRGKLQFAYQSPEVCPPELRPRSHPPFNGLHGSLSPEETLVPLLALRL